MSYKLTAAAFEHAGLSPVNKLVLIGLAHHRSERTGICEPSLSILAQECGLSERHIRRAISSLKSASIITQKQDGSGPSKYEFPGLASPDTSVRPDSVPARTNRAHQPGHQCPPKGKPARTNTTFQPGQNGGGSKLDTDNREQRQATENYNYSFEAATAPPRVNVESSADIFGETPAPQNGHSDLGSDGFAEFWKEYPRKVQKGPALTRWKTRMKALRNDAQRATLRDSIMACLLAYKASGEWHETKYTPHPKTFLGWEVFDVPESHKSSNGARRLTGAKSLDDRAAFEAEHEDCHELDAMNLRLEAELAKRKGRSHVPQTND